MIIPSQESIKTVAKLTKTLLKVDSSRQLLIWFSLHCQYSLLNVMNRFGESSSDSKVNTLKTINLFKEYIKNPSYKIRHQLYEINYKAVDSYSSVNWHFARSLTNIFEINTAVDYFAINLIKKLMQYYTIFNNTVINDILNGKIEKNISTLFSFYKNYYLDKNQKNDYLRQSINRYWYNSTYNKLLYLIHKSFIDYGRCLLSTVKKPDNLQLRHVTFINDFLSKDIDDIKDNDVYYFITYLNDEEIVVNLLDFLSDYIDKVIDNPLFKDIDKFIIKELDLNIQFNSKIEKAVNYIKHCPSMKILLQFWGKQLI